MRALLFVMILSACSPARLETKRMDDEYVLVEFASRLEEDYEKNGGQVVHQ